MTSATHAMTMNGRTHGELKDPDASPEELLRSRPKRLDGVDLYSLSLWRLPVGTEFDDVDFAIWPQEYLQVAGSKDRLIAELRRIEPSGVGHYAIGRPTHGQRGTATEVSVPWNAHETTVAADEVLDAEDAAALFVSYFATSDVPEGFTLRPLDLR